MGEETIEITIDELVAVRIKELKADNARLGKIILAKDREIKKLKRNLVRFPYDAQKLLNIAR